MSHLQNNNIRLVEGVPKPSDFGSHSGTPLVINSITGIAYYFARGFVRPLQAGPIDVAGAFSNGFSAGFA
jgi:hypothetical protein